LQSRLADHRQFTPRSAAIVCNERELTTRAGDRAVRGWCLETTCTVQLRAGKPGFRESKQLRALRRLGYLLKTYWENSFSRARAFTNFRQIGAFGNHLLQLEINLVGSGRSVRLCEWGCGGVGDGESVRVSEWEKSCFFPLLCTLLPQHPSVISVTSEPSKASESVAELSSFRPSE
jgi:hypothetical protein